MDSLSYRKPVEGPVDCSSSERAIDGESICELEGNLIPTETPQRVAANWRRVATPVLVMFVGCLGILVYGEIATLPEHTLEGAVLQARIRFATSLRTGLGTPGKALGSKLPYSRVLPGSHLPSKLSSTRNGEQTRASTPVATKHDDALVVESNVKPLQPFRVEVVDGKSRKMLNPQSKEVEVDIAAGAMATPASSDRVSMSGLSAGAAARRSVVLRAIVGTNGRAEQLWKVSGPVELTGDAIRIAREAHLRPFYNDGVPTEAEAILTVTFPALNQ